MTEITNEEFSRNVVDPLILFDRHNYLACNSRALAAFGFNTLEDFHLKNPFALSVPAQAKNPESGLSAEQHFDTAVQKGSTAFHWGFQRADDQEKFTAEVQLNAIELFGRTVFCCLLRNVRPAISVVSMGNRDAPASERSNSQLRQLVSPVNQFKSLHSGYHVAVLYVGLDRIKRFRVSSSNKNADRLLVETARRIRLCLRTGDKVLRPNEEEFVVLIGHLDQDDRIAIKQALMIAERVRTRLAEPYFLTLSKAKDAFAVDECLCSSSIGIDLIGHCHADSADIIEILGNARSTMNKIRGSGGNALEFFTRESLKSKSIHRIERAADFPAAAS